MTRAEEIQFKLTLMRAELQRCDAKALRLKRSDWLFWATAGADHTMLVTSEMGIAEIVVTPNEAWVLTDEIEAARLNAEQAPPGFKFHVRPWADEKNLDSFVLECSEGGKVICDRPSGGEVVLDDSLQQQRVALTPSEISRFKEVGLLASQAMTEVLMHAQSHWSELALAGAASECLCARGLTPALILAAGSKRLAQYRHPLPSKESLGAGAMLVFCARGFGLYANLTRFVSFAKPRPELSQLQKNIFEIEATVLAASKPKQSLSEIYTLLAEAYARIGMPHAIKEHHQGGLTGYLAREAIAQPSSKFFLETHSAVAWNPSFTGAKVEDTFLINIDGDLENLTFDDAWPHTRVAGRLRPQVWQA